MFPSKERITTLIGKSLRRPEEIKDFLYWDTVGRVKCYPSKKFFPAQKSMIREDLVDEDKFLLIILDSCRWDYFFPEYSMYFDGELSTVYSSGRDTFEYVSNTWDGSHEDMLYVSGAPPVNSALDMDSDVDRPHLYGGYVPDKHLRIEDVHLKEWDDDFGTCMPGDVTDAALDNLESEDKMVAHYFQPHSPYIGEFRPAMIDGNEPYLESTGNLPERVLWRQVRNGEITRSQLKRAYKSNLRAAFSEVKRLVERVEDDRRVVITSDHGEMLGDSGLYAHPRKHHPKLRQVPWLEVEGVKDFEQGLGDLNHD